MRLLALALSIIAATPAHALEAPIPPGTTARIGQTIRVGGIAVRPIAVVEDSRCPRDVMCVWAGRLRLRAAVAGREVVLTLNQPHALPRGRQLILVTADPERYRAPPRGQDPTLRFGFRIGR